MGKIDQQPEERSLPRFEETLRGLAVAKRALRYSPSAARAARDVVAVWDTLVREGGLDEPVQALAGLGTAERETWRESLSRVRVLASEGDESGFAGPSALLDLRDQVDWLSRALDSCQRAERAGWGWGARVWNPSFSGLLAVVAVGVLALATVAAEPATPRPWRASFHPNLELKSGPGHGGEPVVRYQPRIHFSWGRRSPVPGLTADAFSVRWDGCLTIPEARAGGAGSEAGSDASSAAGGRELRFRLRSDDDARVWLGERSLLRAWNPRGPSEQSSDLPLAPGTYAIRVEYRDIRGPALISLAIEDISRGIEDDLRSSPDAWLTPPPKPFRASDPCGLAAGEESE